MAQPGGPQYSSFNLELAVPAALPHEDNDTFIIEIQDTSDLEGDEVVVLQCDTTEEFTHQDDENITADLEDLEGDQDVAEQCPDGNNAIYPM
ncbi:Centrosomal protein of 78 kDa [Frankliniella fusca]|uniref:Centrosomal protein of 78 kDa n=1 Tax=Frankliniella fusca TaxID=407009 RepID=A0AAE1GR72_9NEOP|nr:Centrosomal protein of 78 kDa [Frankliniella fusca]